MPRADYYCPACRTTKEVEWSIHSGPPPSVECERCYRLEGPVERIVWRHRLWNSAPYVHVSEKIHVGNALGRAHDYTTKEYDEMRESWPRTVGEREGDEQREIDDQAKKLNAPIEVS